MPPRQIVRGIVATAAAAGFALLLPTAASAHSLESSTVSVHVNDDASVDATISIALETLDEALGTDYASGDVPVEEYADEVADYLAAHLTVTGADGSEWVETFSNPAVESVEGISSLSIEVAFDSAGADVSSFVLAYDAIIEAIPGHEAVVVLTDAAGNVSTPGVITTTSDTVSIFGESSAQAAEVGAGFLDMVGHGLHHVLAGADHLLFLFTLLLTAPLIVVAGRWQLRGSVLPTLRNVLGVTTAFTIGHSITLIASSLGWITLPTTLVEVLVAASVGVAALHVFLPLFRGGEKWIAGGFGLVHGLAFAGILTSLGLTGSMSVMALLSFNVGVELAQLLATALLFPSIFLLARTRWYGVARWVGGAVALAAASGWMAERLGWFTSPLAPLEAAAITHPWVVVIGLFLIALIASVTHRHAPRSTLHHKPFADLGSQVAKGRV